MQLLLNLWYLLKDLFHTEREQLECIQLYLLLLRRCIHFVFLSQLCIFFSLNCSQWRFFSCAGRYRAPLRICAGDHILHHLLFIGCISVDFFEVRLVFVLHVLHNAVLHTLRDDDDGNNTQSQCGCNHRSPTLHAVEPFQRIHDSSQGTH